jgi:hypothetical protein
VQLGYVSSLIFVIYIVWWHGIVNVGIVHGVVLKVIVPRTIRIARMSRCIPQWTAFGILGIKIDNFSGSCPFSVGDPIVVFLGGGLFEYHLGVHCRI